VARRGPGMAGSRQANQPVRGAMIFASAAA